LLCQGGIGAVGVVLTLLVPMSRSAYGVGSVLVRSTPLDSLTHGPPPKHENGQPRPHVPVARPRLASSAPWMQNAVSD